MRRADAILREIERLAEKEFLPIIGPGKGKIITRVIREARPRRVLEVGTLIGYSAILIGKELPADGELITIEIHKDEAKRAKENIRNADLPPSVSVLVGNAINLIPRLKGSFDLVFLDAEKSEHLDYLRLVEDKLHRGSIVIADNAGILARQMRHFLEYVRSSRRFRSGYVPVGEDGIEVSVKL